MIVSTGSWNPQQMYMPESVSDDSRFRGKVSHWRQPHADICPRKHWPILVNDFGFHSDDVQYDAEGRGWLTHPVIDLLSQIVIFYVGSYCCAISEVVTSFLLRFHSFEFRIILTSMTFLNLSINSPPVVSHEMRTRYAVWYRYFHTHP